MNERQKRVVTLMVSSLIIVTLTFLGWKTDLFSSLFSKLTSGSRLEKILSVDKNVSNLSIEATVALNPERGEKYIYFEKNGKIIRGMGPNITRFPRKEDWRMGDVLLCEGRNIWYNLECKEVQKLRHEADYSLPEPKIVSPGYVVKDNLGDYDNIGDYVKVDNQTLKNLTYSKGRGFLLLYFQEGSKAYLPPEELEKELDPGSKYGVTGMVICFGRSRPMSCYLRVFDIEGS